MQGKIEQPWIELPGLQTKIELLTLRREGCNSGRKKIGWEMGMWEEQSVGAAEREDVQCREEKRGKGCHRRVQGRSIEQAATDMGCQSQDAHHWQEHPHQKGHPQPRHQDPQPRLQEPHPQGLSEEHVRQHPGDQTEANKVSKDLPHTLICPGCFVTSSATTKDFQ